MNVNPFRGINPHLNSLLQTPGTEESPSSWSSFHNTHVIHLTDALNRQLPRHYAAYPEQSLQSRDVDWGGGEVVLRVPEPDVTVAHRRLGTVVAPQAGERPLSSVWEAAIKDIFDPLKRPQAVIIRAMDTPARYGRVVMRIELLSPANKPKGRHFDAYTDNRAEALETGVPLVEIDYLHEQPTVIPTHPIYPHDAESFPYLISITDPRPSWQQGRVRVFRTQVDERLPILDLPLLNEDMITLNFDDVYQYTFASTRYYDMAEPEREPARMHTYSADDQARIRAVMAREQAANTASSEAQS